MNPERWQRLRRLFELVADVEEGSRKEVLANECPDDPELRAEVLGLVAHDGGPVGTNADELGDATLSLVRDTRSATPAADTGVGQSIEHIRIVRRLGSGGMGDVYLGFDEKLQREVAVKAIRGDRRLTSATRKRFLREARILSRLDHPHVCRIYNFIEGQDQDLIVLELVPGRDLSEIAVAEMSEKRRLVIALGIAEALAAAHEAGVVHRDLKPQNVMLGPGDQVKVLDFGLAYSSNAARARGASSLSEEQPARLTETSTVDPSEDETLVAARGSRDPRWGAQQDSLETQAGSIVGTPSYMSPEQARGEATQTSSDMFSFGLVLQYLLTGEPAYPKELSLNALLHRAANADTLPVPALSKPLRLLLEQLLSRAPSSRPNAVETVARIQWVLDAPKRRLRRASIAAAVTVAVLAGLKYTVDLRAARDIAEGRRAQAESLIGFMLGDLREKLNEVGRLQLLDDVGERATEYFNAIPAEQMSNDEILFRSRSLNQIGDVRISQGRLPEAAIAFRNALTLSSELVDRAPKNEEYLARDGEAHFWLGNVYWQQERYEEARASWRDYLQSSMTLQAVNPDEPNWRLEVAYGHSNLGAVARQLGNFDTALRESSEAVTVMAALSKADPSSLLYRRELATALSWRARAEQALDQVAAAEESHLMALNERRWLLAAEPENAQRLLEVAYSQAHLSELLFDRNRLDEARIHAEQFESVQQQLVDRDPDNQGWLVDLGFARCLAARIGSASQRPEYARRLVEDGLSLLEQAVLTDPANENWRSRLIQGQLSASWIASEAERWGDALAHASEASQQVLELKAGGAERQDLALLTAEAWILAGLAETALGDERGPAHLRQAVDLLAPEQKEPAGRRELGFWLLATVALESERDLSGPFERLIEKGPRSPSLLAALKRAGLGA